MPPDAPEYVAFDLESTGLSMADDRIVEVGAVRFGAGGAILDRYECLIRPDRPSGSIARSIHGIDDEQIAAAESAARVLPGFVRFLGDPAATTLLAHNAIFDAGLLGAELARSGLPIPAHAVVDTLSLARARWPAFGSHKLGALAGRLGLDPAGSHRALADAGRVRGLWLAIEPAGRPGEGVALAYPIFDGTRPPPPPLGWAGVAAAIAGDNVVRIEYDGGTRGPAPRDVRPLGFANRGGVAYLVARCLLDDREKQFRLDRVRRHAVLERA